MDVKTFHEWIVSQPKQKGFSWAFLDAQGNTGFANSQTTLRKYDKAQVPIVGLAYWETDTAQLYYKPRGVEYCGHFIKSCKG